MQFDGVSVRLSAHASEPITCEIIIDSDERDRRMGLLHDNVRRYGTVLNTVAPGTELSGVLRRKAWA
jgi:hypothetical protein